MAAFTFGLVHAPLTPFAGGGIDYSTYGKVLDFHLSNGAEGLALPMHAGESVSLAVEERKALLDFAIKYVRGQVPIIVNVSEAGTTIAASLASHARRAGAAAIVASVPYYWTPPQSMLVEHFAAIGAVGELPFFVYNSPNEMSEVEFASKSVGDLIACLPNFTGLIDASLDWQYMIEVVSVARAMRPDFQFVSGTEFMISAHAIGATGLLSALATVSPCLVGELYAKCRAENYQDARRAQEDAAIVFRAFQDTSAAGLKAAMRAMGRDCGSPRPPLLAYNETETQALMGKLSAAQSIKGEPRGWA
ncbi:MAG: dihydrodipicolinate synthase family protein [Pseudolabrys sp.]